MICTLLKKRILTIFYCVAMSSSFLFNIEHFEIFFRVIGTLHIETMSGASADFPPRFARW